MRDSFAVHRWSRYICGMQGRFYLMALTISMVVPAAATAAEAVRKPACPKIDSQHQATPQQQQRTRAQECRATKTLPPIIDPTPTFLL